MMTALRKVQNPPSATSLKIGDALFIRCFPLPSLEFYRKWRCCEMQSILDSGSQSSFITEHCSQALRLQKHPEMLNLADIGNNSNQVCMPTVDLNFKSMITDERIHVKAFVLPKVAGKLPTLNKQSS